MKKLISLLFLLFFSIIFSQEYYFNRKCVNSSTRIKPKIENINSWRNDIYFNTTNNNYYMKQTNDEPDNYYIVDNSLKEIITLEYRNNNPPFYSYLNKKSFNYDYAEKKIRKIIIKELEEDEFLVECFANKKSKKTNLEIKFKLLKSNTPIVEIKFMDLSQIIHDKIYDSLKEKLNGNNFWILSTEVDYRNGYKFFYEFNECEENEIALKFN